LSRKKHDFGSLVCIYSQLLPRVRAIGKKLGYAIAIHGTLTRDFDMLAVPWIKSAAAPDVLVKAIADEVGGFVIGRRKIKHGYVSDRPNVRPHGRLSWNICWGGRAFIDLSVMPRAVAQPGKD
jgi:hypothetical protein